MKVGPLSGTLKVSQQQPLELWAILISIFHFQTLHRPQHRTQNIRNVQQIHTPTTSSTMPKEANSDLLSRVSFNIIGSSPSTASSANIPQKITTSQPYTVKLVSLPQKTTTTMTKSKPQIVHQLSQPIPQQHRQQPQQPHPQFVANGTEMSHRTEIERQIAELKNETEKLRKLLELSQKQNDENKKETQELRKKLELSQKESDGYKFRLEKLESEKEQEREERLSRQYTNSWIRFTVYNRYHYYQINVFVNYLQWRFVFLTSFLTSHHASLSVLHLEPSMYTITLPVSVCCWSISSDGCYETFYNKHFTTNE